MDSNNTSLFEWKSYIEYATSAEFDFTFSFNYKLFQLEYQNSTITKNEYGNANLALLETWIVDSLYNYLENNNDWKLFKPAVDISKMFSEVNEFIDNDNGIYLGGSPYSQPQIKKFERDLLYR